MPLNSPQDAAACITRFRTALHGLLTIQTPRRDTVVMALDGIPFALAAQMWTSAQLRRMRSVFPTTSSSAWLSALTGMTVAQHGVPGVVFKYPECGLINVYTHAGPMHIPVVGTVFTDAQQAGYVPLAVLGDLEGISGAWIDALLAGAQRVQGHRFYSRLPRPDPDGITAAVEAAVLHAQALHPHQPKFIWCFVEIDRLIHREGYSDEVLTAIAGLGSLAERLAHRGMLVVAHSDHGLVPTRHNPDVQNFLSGLESRFSAKFGGAGRARWVYTAHGTENKIRAALEDELSAFAAIRPADDVFGVGGLARERVGELVLIARGNEFVTFDGDVFDHGSDSQEELDVPYAVWGAQSPIVDPHLPRRL